MLARAEKLIKIVLELTEQEALWLQGYMQNGFPGEDLFTAQKREQLFSALKKELDLNPTKRHTDNLDLDIRDI
jgi:hypothetical protein